MLPQQIIRKKRDGGSLTAAELQAFVKGITAGSVSEGQIGAFAMAVFLNGMKGSEILALTEAMRDSGRVLSWSGSGVDERRVIEKHSSGGVGDEKITLIVAPLAAACGVLVPNLSARGLDYCAGEVDLLDSIPGYETAPTVDRFVETVTNVGCAIIGPTPELVPADRKIYFVRDVTATVESIPLITSSIMSKKLALSPSGLVVSVGCGSGAYMPTLDEARKLAETMAYVSAGAGIDSVMSVTDLSCVLGRSVGNALAVTEAVEFLSGSRRDPRVSALVLAIVADMVVLAGLEPELDRAKLLAGRRLAEGAAAETFGRMIAALGGPADFLSQPARHLPAAPYVQPVFAHDAGYVQSMDARALGHVLVTMGGGRARPEDQIDLAVGMSEIASLGEQVDQENPLCMLHARDEASWTRAAESVRSAFVVSGTRPPEALPIVLERLATPASA